MMRAILSPGPLLLASFLLVLAAVLLLIMVSPTAAQGGGIEPANVRVTPGDGILTVSWTVTSRKGVADDDVLHALRWSQEAGVWANPTDPRAVGANDGISVAGGVSKYVITGLKNSVSTGVFVRSHLDDDYTEGSGQSSRWVRVKGEHTTLKAEEKPTPAATPTPTPTAVPAPQPQEPEPPQAPQPQVSTADCSMPADGDYDRDDDGLIDIDCLARLDAVRWDIDGDGEAVWVRKNYILTAEDYADGGAATYAAAFPNAAAGMGCPVQTELDSGLHPGTWTIYSPTRCIGYELVADLDFDTNGNGEADAGDAWWNGGKGWKPIEEYGYSMRSWVTPVFEGNGHTVSNLFIDRGGKDYVGLFGEVGYFHIRNVVMDSVDVTGRNYVGGLMGDSSGTKISASYVNGKVSGQFAVGGLSGLNAGLIQGSHSDGSVSGATRVGGLVGDNRGGYILDSYSLADVSGRNSEIGGLAGSSSRKYQGAVNIRGSYAGGDVSGGSANAVGGLVGKNYGSIVASYATGAVSSSGLSIGGLVGANKAEIRASYSISSGVSGLVGYGWNPNWLWRDHLVSVTNSYWSAPTSGPHRLKAPTGYAGIYANWNEDIDGIHVQWNSYKDGGDADDPWDFGTQNQYPALKRLSLSVSEQRGEPATAPVVQTEIPEAQGTFSVSGTASAAEGENAALTITLSTAAPDNGVAFTVKAAYSGDTTATALDVGGITSPVTVAAGDTTLEIAIPAFDDDVDEDDETFTVVIAASTAGWTKEGDGKDIATVTITDNDTAGVTVSPTSLTINEGGSAAYTVVLDSVPSDLVTITASSGDLDAVSVDPATYVVSPSDWNTPRTFTVSGVADADAEHESVTISHGINGFQDAKYNVVTVPSVIVTVQDTTPRNFSVTPTARAAEGSDATLTVTLTATAPTGGAEFGVAVNHDSGAGKAEASDVGTVPQTVSVAAGDKTASLTIPLAEDDLTEGDEIFTVTLTPPTGWTAASVGDDIATVTITDVPPPVAAPGPVESLELSAAGDRITVAWQAPQSGGAPETYLLNLKNTDDGKDKHKTVQAGKTSATFRNLEAGATYRVWVRAVNAGGKSERVRATITLPEPPGPVVNLSASVGSDDANSVIVAWEAPQSGGAVSNYVVRLTPSDGGKDRVKRPGAGKTTVTFRNLDPGATYEVKVRAENKVGKGEPVRASVTLPE